jgi:serine/threonine protein kinase
MNEHQLTSSDSSSLLVHKRIDEVCDIFENAWQTGRRPEIEEHLAETTGRERAELFRELLKLELTYRREAREEPVPEEFLSRFPEWAELINAVFCDRSLMAPTQAPATAAPAPTEPFSGPVPAWPVIPGYEILEAFPPGGMGIVYKAREIHLNRVVALKKIRYEALAGPTEQERFRREAEAIARLKHPNIVQIHHYGAHSGLPYFSMEFMEGGTLEKRLRDAPLSPMEAAQVVETLAGAMHYAHKQKIIHRDLKPANVLLTADGIPKIADFGLAKNLDERSGITATGVVVGTVNYMAPEQAAGNNSAVGVPADIYALGAILYELLAGQPPFQAASRELTIQRVLSDDPPVPPSQLRENVPDDLEAICLKCLEKAPGERYGSAEGLAEHLRRFQNGEEIFDKQRTNRVWYPSWPKRAGYEILDIAGCSVLGMIYKARQVRLNRTVLFKTISAPARSEEAKLTRFRTEAEIAARLHHPNIIQIFDYDEYQGQPYMSMEFVEGETLAEKCRGDPMPAREAAKLVAVLARAAHHAHENGIVHSDLRPFNVLITREGVPKITGLGLARLLEQGNAQCQGAPLWLSNYMAPEQADGRLHALGPATDVHALGAMLYEMLVGRPPFLADTVRDTVEQIRTRVPVPPSRWRAEVPKGLEAICVRCLQKTPEQRFPSAKALAEELERFLFGEQPKTGEFELIPGYELLEELGHGGTGTVHKARQVRLDLLVALKLFYDGLPARTLTRIRIASRAMARLNHPNLLHVYDCGERDGIYYLAEEYVEGVTLDQRCVQTTYSASEAACLVETIARAIHHAHQHGIVHRNLKPRVVLLTAEGTPKISSFELAKVLGQEVEAGEEEVALVGTPTYMAPEQAGGPVQAIGPATDVHGLGIILYELLTGRVPFMGNTALELLEQVRFRQPTPPSRLASQVPRGLDRICLRCLQKEPGQRYSTAEALADDLRYFLAKKWASNSLNRLWQRLFGWPKR